MAPQPSSAPTSAAPPGGAASPQNLNQIVSLVAINVLVFQKIRVSDLRTACQMIKYPVISFYSTDPRLGIAIHKSLNNLSVILAFNMSFRKSACLYHLFSIFFM